MQTLTVTIAVVVASTCQSPSFERIILIMRGYGSVSGVAEGGVGRFWR